MKYMHITVIVEAAEKCYKAICIIPDEFKDVILYLENFHNFMHSFSTCGKFLSNSRLEGNLYHARMCSVGRIRPF